MMSKVSSESYSIAPRRTLSFDLKGRLVSSYAPEHSGLALVFDEMILPWNGGRFMLDAEVVYAHVRPVAQRLCARSVQALDMLLDGQGSEVIGAFS